MQKIFSLIAFSCLFVLNSQVPNINISNGNIFDGEPFIAVNPINHQHVTCAWMGYVFGSGSALTIRVKTSYNGGTTWTSAVNMPHMSSTFKSADVSMAYDNTGKLFMSYIDYRESPDSGGVYVCNSLNEGLTWSTPVKIIDAYSDGSKRPIDRPWISVDPTGTKVCITTKPAPWILPPNRPYFISSADGGNTWNNWRYLDSTGYLVGNLIAQPMAAVAHAGISKTVTVYPSYLPSQSVYARLICAYTTNNGNSFSYKVMINLTGSGTNNDSAKLGYRLVANPSDSNHLAFITPSNSSGEYDVMLMESFNGGNTWTAPLRINDDPIGNNKLQDLVWGDFDNNGNLLITWRDRRNGGGSSYATASEIFYAYRNKDSVNFQPNGTLSTNIVPYNNILSQNGNDFMCSVLQDDTLNAAWGDTRDGSLDIWYVRMKASTGTLTSMQLIESSSTEIVAQPNPTQDFLTAGFRSGIATEEYFLYDLNGKLIQSEKINRSQFQLNLSTIKKGIYILMLKNSAGSHTVKVVRD
jgi:hypothetical protein